MRVHGNRAREQETGPAGKPPEWKVGLSDLQRILRERSLRLANLTMAMILWDQRLNSLRASEDSVSASD